MMYRYYGLLMSVFLLGSPIVAQQQDNRVQSSGTTLLQRLKPDYLLLREIHIKAPIQATEEGVIVEVRVVNRYDPALNTIVRYSGWGGVLPLRSDNTQVLSPPIQIPNDPTLEVRVNVIAVPKEFTVEGLDVIAFIFDKLAEAATDAALRKQPLLKLLPDYLLARMLDRTKSELQKGRVIGSARVDAHRLAALSGMGIPEISSVDDRGIPDGDKFVITVEPVSKTPR